MKNTQVYVKVAECVLGIISLGDMVWVMGWEVKSGSECREGNHFRHLCPVNLM